MTTDIRLQDIGNFEDVPVVSILVSVGDVIAVDDPLIEVENDKATIEVLSSGAGVVRQISIRQGDKVSEGDVILITEDSKQAPAIADTAAEVFFEGGESTGRAPQPAPTSSAAEPVKTATDTLQVIASPSVRAFARRMDVDLNQLADASVGKRLQHEDVAVYLKSASAAAAGGMGIPPIPKINFAKFGSIENVEMPRIKTISGPALHRSWLNIPHVTHQDEADISDLDKYRKDMDMIAKKDGYRVTLLSFVIKACTAALKAHWEINSSLHPDGDKLIKKDFYNIGFAAETPNGLVVPVVKDVDRKGLIDISREVMELSAKARAGELNALDMQGATFTISSLGGIGGTSFTPIVNAPEVAILGLARSKMAPVWNGEEFKPRLMQPLSLSYDHRAIDGALAARFCVTLKSILGDIRRILW